MIRKSAELLDVSLFGPQGSIAGKPPSPFIEVGDGFLIPAGAQPSSAWLLHREISKAESITRHGLTYFDLDLGVEAWPCVTE